MIKDADIRNMKDKLPICIMLNIPEGIKKELRTQLDYIPLWIVKDEYIEKYIKEGNIAIGIDELWETVKEGADIQAQRTLAYLLVKERALQLIAILNTLFAFSGNIIDLTITKTKPDVANKKKTTLALFE